MVAQREIDLRDEGLAGAFLPRPGRVQSFWKLTEALYGAFANSLRLTF